MSTIGPASPSSHPAVDQAADRRDAKPRSAASRTSRPLRGLLRDPLFLAGDGTPTRLAPLAASPAPPGGLELAPQRQHLRRVGVRALGERRGAQPGAARQQRVERARRSDLR